MQCGQRTDLADDCERVWGQVDDGILWETPDVDIFQFQEGTKPLDIARGDQNQPIRTGKTVRFWDEVPKNKEVNIADPTRSLDKTGEKEPEPSSGINLFKKRWIRNAVTILVVALLFAIGLATALFGNAAKSTTGDSKGSSPSDDWNPPPYYPPNTQGNGPGQTALGNLPYFPDNILVGVYYYPWHGDDFHGSDGYVRKMLEPPQRPAIGDYNDSETDIVGQHLTWSRQANVGLWVTAWWGPDRLEDRSTKDIILGHAELGDMKVALHYEAIGRIRGKNMTDVKNDIEYMCQEYFDKTGYYKIDGRPVVVMYVTRKLETLGLLERTILTIRSTANKMGHNIYLIGDHAFRQFPINKADNYVPFYYFDAVTTFDVYGSMNSPTHYAGTDVVDSFYADQYVWRTEAKKKGCSFVPVVCPGFNDRGVRLEMDREPLSRRLTEDSAPSTFFSYSLAQARRLVDPSIGSLMMVNSFNEWHEDTQIEPAYGSWSTTPETFTRGVNYTGYGELYLDLLRQGTKRNGFRAIARNSGHWFEP